MKMHMKINTLFPYDFLFNLTTSHICQIFFTGSYTNTLLIRIKNGSFRGVTSLSLRFQQLA